MFNKPVIIIGAPRSGTSLLHQIIREHPAFISVPRESDVIWNPYCHPAKNNWDSEGISDAAIDDKMLLQIREIFARSALPASTWQRWSKLGLMQHPVLAKVIRKIYRPAFALLTGLRKPHQHTNKRLVDKSVHCPLWLNLVEAVFPDALYIHITRNGFNTVDSMLDGWLLESKRFNTYHLPELVIKGYSSQNWNFALPYGWREYADKPLENVVVFQWIAIQQAILTHLQNKPQRCLQIKLEDLTSQPAMILEQLADFMEVSNDFSQYAQAVPVVNASEKKVKGLRYPQQIARIAPLLESLQIRLGYSVDN